MIDFCGEQGVIDGYLRRTAMKMQCLLLAVGGGLGCSAAVMSETITVCLDGGCDYADIQSAIGSASDGDVIMVSAETFLPVDTLNTHGKSISIRGSVDGQGVPVTIIDGQDSILVLRCESGEGKDTVFENLVITGGTGGMSNFNSSPTLLNCIFKDNNGEGSAGGMHNWESSPDLTDCVFDGNSSWNGGAMVCTVSSSPMLENCTFVDNIATNTGGGILIASSCMPRLNNCAFINNTASIEGGGIWCCCNSTPKISWTVLCGNAPEQIYGPWLNYGGTCLSLVCRDTDGDARPDCHWHDADSYLSVPGEYATIEEAFDAASEGALISVAAGTFTPAVTLDSLGKSIELRGAVDSQGGPGTIIDGQGTKRVIKCVSGEGDGSLFANIFVTGGRAYNGGGMYVGTDSSLSLMNCTFSGNAALDDGGGIYFAASDSSLEGCVFVDNSAADEGGAIYLTGSDIALSQCEFNNNSAEDDGGGLSCRGSNLTFDHCSFVGNVATDDAGALMNRSGSTLLLVSCMLLENVAAGEGGGMYNDSSSVPVLSSSTVCDNAPDQIYGAWKDDGGNTICSDKGCTSDLDGNGAVDGGDLNVLLGEWGSQSSLADINTDGLIDGADLNLLLGAWGNCP
jgi:parallel beta-helix repeat protein/predicted outer membrane repeat protein